MLELFKSLADPCRLRLLRILHQGEFTVQELTSILEMGQSRISRHLKILCDVEILQVEPQGTWRYYRFAPRDEMFISLWPVLESHFNVLPDAEQDTAGIERIMRARRQRSRDFFDEHAESWDHLRDSRLRLPDYQSQLLALIPEQGIVAEVGVGSGQLLNALSRRTQNIIGIDHSPAMVDKARLALEQDSNDQVEVRLGEMMHLPLADASMNGLVLNQVFHHAERPLDVLAEIKRVLMPDGTVVIADLIRHDQDWMREELADQWLGFGHAELSAWLQEAGLEEQGYRRIDAEAGEYTVFLLWATLPA
jgi:ArsR family transcriptional regulator